MGIKKLTGRKPGHNASSKGFVTSPPVKPSVPTSAPVFQPINRQDRLQNNSKKNSPPKPPEWNHIQKYGVTCYPGEYFGKDSNKRKTHNCICGREWASSDIGAGNIEWEIIVKEQRSYDSFGLAETTREEHLAKYGAENCFPKDRLFRRNNRVGRVHSCKCGKQWIIKNMAGIKGDLTWMEIEAVRDKHSSLTIPNEAHITRYGTSCLPKSVIGSGKVGSTHTCVCGQLWIIKDMSNVQYQSKGAIEWTRATIYNPED